MTRRARFTVAYDGADFHGFAEQVGARTVMGDLRIALEKIIRGPVNAVGAGRTDTGVHGWGQVISLDLPERTDLDDLQRRINKMCGPTIGLRDGQWCSDPEFHARYSATWRRYRYHVLNRPEPVPFLAGTTWYVPDPLQVWAMQLACDPLIGAHDFTSFCRRPKGIDPEVRGEPSMIRYVMSADWREVHDEVSGSTLLRFEITANAFCHQMVRSLVGTLVEVGRGRIHAGEMRSILLARDRKLAGKVAPAQGLVLWEVGYGGRESSTRVHRP